MTMRNEPLTVQVQCYAGYREEQTPRRFSMGERTVEVAEVLDAWLAPFASDPGTQGRA